MLHLYKTICHFNDDLLTLVFSNISIGVNQTNVQILQKQES